MASTPVFSVIHPIIHQSIPAFADLIARSNERAKRAFEAAAALAAWRARVDAQIRALRDEQTARPWPAPARADSAPSRHDVLPIDLLRALLAIETEVVGDIVPSPNGLLTVIAEHWRSVVDAARPNAAPVLDAVWARQWALADLRFGGLLDLPYLVASLGFETLSTMAPLSKLMDQDLASEREVVRRCVENARRYTADRVFEPVLPAYLDRHGGIDALDCAVDNHHGVLIVGNEGTGRTALLEAWLRRLELSGMPKSIGTVRVWKNPFQEPWMRDERELEREIATRPTLLSLNPKGRRVYYDSREEETLDPDEATPERLWGYEPEYAAGSLESALIERCAAWASEPWKQVYLAIVVTPAERERLVARVPLVSQFPAVQVPPMAPQDHLPVWLSHTMDRPHLGLSQALAIMSEVRPADVPRMKPWEVEPVLGSGLAQRLWDPDKLRELRPASWLERALSRIRNGRDPWQREMLGAKGRFVERFIGDDIRFSALVGLEDFLRSPTRRAAKPGSIAPDQGFGRGTVPPTLHPRPTTPVPPRMSSRATDLFFVFRNQHEGPLSKRVRRIRGSSVLEWFQMAWYEAVQSPDPEVWVNEVFGGFVPGLASLFQAVADEGLDAPDTWNELQELLQDHLYVPGDTDDIRQSSRALRVRTQHDDIEMAYYMFDAAYAAAHPDRCSYLLHDEWPLPTDASNASFEPEIRTAPMLPAGAGEGATYVCLLTNYHNGSLRDLRVRVFPGVRLPGLAAHLRGVTPVATERRGQGNFAWFDTWPMELRLLRAMVESGDTTIEPALQRCNRYPISHVATHIQHTRVGIGPHAQAHEDFADAALEARHVKRDIERSRISVAEHIAQMSLWANHTYGYQQWFLFDDRWAGAHAHLACSLLRYASGWDPLL